MRKYQSNISNFIRRTRRRFIIEVSVLLVLVGYFWLAWPDSWPDWMELSVLMAFAAFVLYDLAYYPKTKEMAQGFFVCLMDDALGFPHQKAVQKIPYSDIRISKVIKKNGDVVAIGLKTVFGQSITLEGLGDMNDLYEGLVDHLGHKNKE